MTTAREQAKKAAVEGWENFTPETYKEIMRNSRLIGANRASNVWESLLREAKEVLQNHMFWSDGEDEYNNNDVIDMIRKIDDALGETNERDN